MTIRMHVRCLHYNIAIACCNLQQMKFACSLIITNNVLYCSWSTSAQIANRRRYWSGSEYECRGQHNLNEIFGKFFTEFFILTRMR